MLDVDVDLSILLRIIAVGVLIILSGLFSGSETSLFSLTKIQLRKFKKSKSLVHQKILHLLEQPKRLLITILLGNELVNISISALSTSLVIYFLADQFQTIDPKWLTILLVVPFLLLFGEVMPKMIAIKNNERFAGMVCFFLAGFGRIGYPIVWLIFKLTDLVVFMIVGERGKKEAPIMEAEFITLVEESSEAGIVAENEKNLIYRVFDLGNMPISDIMSPRGSIFSLPYDMPLKEMVKEIRQHRYSSIPIYKENRDRIIGILYAKTILALKDYDDNEVEANKKILDKLLVSPLFIPGTKQVYDLFRDVQFKKNQIAIVLDEFGGVIGLVTFSDILEELFGRIEEDHPQSKLWEKTGDYTWLVDARIPLEDFSLITKTPISHEEFETIGGFLFGLFGKLPQPGEIVRYKNLEFTVTNIDVTKINEIKVEKLNPKEKISSRKV